MYDLSKRFFLKPALFIGIGTQYILQNECTETLLFFFNISLFLLCFNFINYLFIHTGWIFDLCIFVDRRFLRSNENLFTLTFHPDSAKMKRKCFQVFIMSHWKLYLRKYATVWKKQVKYSIQRSVMIETIYQMSRV